MQRPRNPCPGLRTARDRRTRSEQFLGRGAADARAGDSSEDRFEKAALLVQHEQRRNCSIPAYARSALATTLLFAHDFWPTLLRRVLGRPWLLAQHICDVGDNQRTYHYTLAPFAPSLRDHSSFLRALALAPDPRKNLR